MQNRFAQLEQNESGPPQSYDGRGSGGRFGRQNSQQDSGYGGRGSRGGSGENDRAKVIQAVRDFGSNRSQSVMGPHPTISRENSAPRSASMVVQKKPEVPGMKKISLRCLGLIKSFHICRGAFEWFSKCQYG